MGLKLKLIKKGYCTVLLGLLRLLGGHGTAPSQPGPTVP